MLWQDNEKSIQKLVLISGATGSIGENYYNYFAESAEYICIGFTRREKLNSFLVLDLDDIDSVQKIISALPLERFSEIIYLHCVGKWDFEEKVPNEPNLIFFHSNVITFCNFVDCLLEKALNNQKHNKQQITLCSFGSIADCFNISHYKSSSYAKNELKKVMKS